MTCARELAVPEFYESMIDTGIQLLLDNTKEREQSMIVNLIVEICKQKIVDPSSTINGVKMTTDNLEDLW